ncbi:uncharacterized protein LOC108439572 isoform X2 [Pygocentrus nattereri]|uniref:uncharacterized protein LOC108439572 isoform X2 n=1 Tax=Pygocentrus nattereri TaxID=42514 RepID=UPI001891E73A|nr:uncharacterized protein LOC108439572 isoform X2 [Pygocentrus nattereri]
MGCLYLLLVAFHFNAGCSLSGEQSIKEVRGHTGGSVVLPCSCTDLQTKPQRVTWQVYRGKEWTEVFSADEYRDRLQQLNEESPANLSLLISDLREEDEGDYRCQTEKESRFFSLFVKGCDLVKSGMTEEVTRFSGESVVLLCSCTDLQTKPNTVKWEFGLKKSVNLHFDEIYSAQTGQHRDRVRLTNKNSGNLSLLMSDLTEEDQGDYRCSVQGDFTRIRLQVKVRETPTHLWTTDRTTTPSVSPSDLPTTHQQAVDLQPTPSVDPPTTLSKSPTTNQHTTFSLQLGRRSRQNVTNKVHLDLNRKQENQTVSDDVTYSKVTHSNTATPARVQISTGEQTEYACIKTN